MVPSCSAVATSAPSSPASARRAAPAADPREIQHNDGLRARGDGRVGELERRPGKRGLRERRAVPQVQREGDAARSDRPDDGPERVERLQGLEPHDHTRRPCRDELARPLRRRDRGVHEQSAAETGQRLQQRALHPAAGEGVEVGHVPLIAVEDVAVGPRQGEGIAFRAVGDEPRADGHIRLTRTAARQHRPPGAQVQHGDHAQ